MIIFIFGGTIPLNSLLNPFTHSKSMMIIHSCEDMHQQKDISDFASVTTPQTNMFQSVFDFNTCYVINPLSQVFFFWRVVCVLKFTFLFIIFKNALYVNNFDFN